MTESDDRRAGVAALAYLTFTLVGSVGGVLRSSDSGPVLGDGTVLIGALIIHFVTAYLIYRMPGHGVTRVLAVMGVLQAVGGYGAALGAAGDPPAGRVAAALMNVAWVGTLPMLALLTLVLPTGRPPSPRWNPVLIVQVVCLVGVAAFGVWFGLSPREGIGPANIAAGVLGVALMVTAIAAAGGQVVRWRRADGEERAQLRVVALACALVVAGYFVTSGLGFSVGLLAVQAVLPAAVGYAVLRHRLYSLEPIVNRVLVWAVLTAGLISLYLAGAVLAAELLPAAPALRAGLLPAAVVAVAFAALRHRAQRLVDRALYGVRGDPATAVRVLARRLAAGTTSEDAPAAVANAVAGTLRLPWVAVQLDRDGQRVTVAQAGSPVDGHETVPLQHAGETVGWLTVGYRRGESSLPAADRRLLTDLAAQAAPAMSAARLIGQLAESRDRLICERQQDRRRLRAELHDHLSPTLTGIALGARTARQLITTDPAAADSLLDRMADNANLSSVAVRRLLADLRPVPPPGPDLVAALADRCDEIGRSAGLEVTLRAQPVPALPEATEVAAYRIAVEALTNVVRHARASRCRVEIGADADLVLAVTDDGVGLDGHGDGVGVASMRERARQAGGTLQIGSQAPQGTRVEARLPLTGPP